jgi:hypothetical protein
MDNNELNNEKFEPNVVLADKRKSIPLNKKIAKIFRSKISAFQATIIISLLFFIAYYLILNTYSQFMVEKILTDEELFQLDKKIQLIKASEKLPTIGPYEPASPKYIRTFGDIFSSLSHINRQLTDMYWDGQVGAFLLPPKLSLKVVENCDNQACNYNIHDRKWQGFCNQEACLERVDNNLFYDNLPLNLPQEFENENILSLDIGGVGGDFFLGFVLGQEFDEKLWVYRFDGNNFEAIIDDSSAGLEELSADRKGGRVAFGGINDDYLIAYTGYFSKILRIKGEEIEDLSEFLPLRLTSRGHYPQIVYSPSSYSYYICNTDLKNPSLVKIWFDKDKNIIGSVDLRQMMFGTKARRLICDYGDKSSHLNLYVLNNNDLWQKWEFVDQGFDQEIVRQVISRNIQRDDLLVKGVFASSYNVNSEKSSDEAYQLFFSNNEEDYLPAVPGRWFELETEGSQLFWRIIFKTANHPYYSPWFSHFSSLNYEFIPEEE